MLWLLDAPFHATIPWESGRALEEFAELYRAHFRFVWRVIRYLGVPSMHAEDVVQETFILANRKLPQFDGRNARGWLFSLARGVARNHLRSLQRTAKREEQAAAPKGAMSPDEAVAKREGLGVVFEILESLDPEKREVFVLCDVEEMTAPQVAELLGVKLNTVYSRLRTARQAFNRAARARADERGDA